MKSSSLTLAATAAFFLSAIPSLAATVMFDDFDTNPQLAVDGAGIGESNVSSVAFGTGQRILTATNSQQSGSNDIGDTQLEIDAGSLSFSNVAGATGSGELQYTNVGDISEGADPFFLFDVGYFDNVAQFTATAIDTDGNESTYTELLQPGFDPQLYFAEFTGSADFNDLATLSFSISTTGGQISVDGTLNSISISAIPLPAGGLLLIAGLGGLAALRRKKRA